jgi:hypothetical protein
MRITNWEPIGALSNILSAIAVIATQGYVAVEIRQNTSALRSAATQGAHDQSASVYDLLAGDPTLSDIFVRGLEAPDTLDSIETGRFYGFVMGVIFRFQNWYLQTRSRALEKEQIESWARILRQISGTPGVRMFWEDRRHICTPALVKYLEQEVFERARPCLSPTWGSASG